MENRLAAQLQVSRNDIRFGRKAIRRIPARCGFRHQPGSRRLWPAWQRTYRNSHLDTLAGSVEDRLKINPMFALIGGVRFEDFQLRAMAATSMARPVTGQPFTANWTPVSYRAAYTFEPVKGLMFYSMYATAYDPAAAGIFSISPGNSLALTSAKIYETGVKQLFWDNRAEWTLAAYDITRNNVYVAISDTQSALAGEIRTKGVELAGAVKPIDDLKLWGNVALTQARFVNFDFEGFTGNTPANVAPIVVNAGASYRFSKWRWPVEFGGSVRHVGNRYLSSDNATTMLAYTTADLYAFVDIPGRELPWQGLDLMRVTFRVRNVTNAVYAQWSDSGLPDQVLLGAPRTYELSASAEVVIRHALS